MKKKLGFDFSRGFNVFPVRLPRNFLKDNPLPQLEDPNKFVEIDGRIFLNNPQFESDILWYLETSQQKL